MGTMRGLLGFAALGVCAGFGGQALAEESAPTAAALMKGGEFCFDMSAPASEAFQHLMLAVEPAGDAIAEVHAIQRGNEGGDEYSNQFTGTATIAPSNDAGSDTPTLYVSLTGNGMGVAEDDTAQLWTFSYSLALDPATLAGKVYGAEFESDPVANGQPFTIKAARGVVADAKPMPCADY
jgi:hypothetical protein